MVGFCDHGGLFTSEARRLFVSGAERWGLDFPDMFELSRRFTARPRGPGQLLHPDYGLSVASSAAASSMTTSYPSATSSSVSSPFVTASSASSAGCADEAISSYLVMVMHVSVEFCVSNCER